MCVIYTKKSIQGAESLNLNNVYECNIYTFNYVICLTVEDFLVLSLFFRWCHIYDESHLIVAKQKKKLKKNENTSRNTL